MGSQLHKLHKNLPLRVKRMLILSKIDLEDVGNSFSSLSLKYADAVLSVESETLGIHELCSVDDIEQIYVLLRRELELLTPSGVSSVFIPGTKFTETCASVNDLEAPFAEKVFRSAGRRFQAMSDWRDAEKLRYSESNQQDFYRLLSASQVYALGTSWTKEYNGERKLANYL